MEKFSKLSTQNSSFSGQIMNILDFCLFGALLGTMETVQGEVYHQLAVAPLKVTWSLQGFFKALTAKDSVRNAWRLFIVIVITFISLIIKSVSSQNGYF